MGITSYKYLPGSYNLRFLWVSAKHLYFTPLSDPKSPFTENVRSTYCALLECDLFGFHKNNATYFTELDLARIDAVLNALHTYFKSYQEKGKKFAFIPLSSITNHFLKEIKPFQNYEIKSKIVGWGEKWMWTVSVFTIVEKRKPDTSNIEIMGKNIAENVPPLYLSDNKRVVAISIGKLVFKNGRKTVSPWEIVNEAGIVDESVNLKANCAEEALVKNLYNPLEILQIYQDV